MIINFKTKNRKTGLAIAIILLFVVSTLMATSSNANAQTSKRKTGAYASVSPKLIGAGQELLVNVWIYPAPAGPGFEYLGAAYEGLTVTFTRPNGSKDTFMPTEPYSGLKAGESEMLGAIWFIYVPTSVGTWSLEVSFPGNDLYTASVSPPFNFVVQSEPVQLSPPAAQLPTGYWQRPINSDNRDWYQISGNWLTSGFDVIGTKYNPFSSAVNSAHILWKRQVNLGGLIGGAYGSYSYGGGTGGGPTGGGSPGLVVMGRVFYNMPGGVFRCVDLRTGEIIYDNKSGSISMASIQRPSTIQAGTPQTESGAPVPYLWELGSSAWKTYDPFTGNLLTTISSIPSVPQDRGFGVTTWLGRSLSAKWVDDHTVYALKQGGWNTTNFNRWAINDFLKWDLTKVTGNNWTTGIVWTVHLSPTTGPGMGGRPSSIIVTSDQSVGIIGTTGEDRFFAFDLNTGQSLWNKTIDHLTMTGISCLPNDFFYTWDSATQTLHAYDMKTGNNMWASDKIGDYPWAADMSYRGIAYGKLYINTMDGHVFAVDYNTGKVAWSFYTGDSSYTSYNTWPIYLGAVIADGKMYVACSEHSPTQPRIVGERTFCLDANTGANIWNVSGAINPTAIAEGYVVGTNENDGTMYCFGKGKTSTTISGPLTAVQEGTSLILTGTVMDQSPASAGTPAIADDDMGPWMDYVHMQKPLTVKVSGLPVTLIAMSSDGTETTIGSVTSDANGMFKKMWTPTLAGEYTIVAKFDGSESYWNSNAETAVYVSAAPTATPAPTATAKVATTDQLQTTNYYIVGSAVLVAVVVIAATAVLVRKRK